MTTTVTAATAPKKTNGVDRSIPISWKFPIVYCVTLALTVMMALKADGIAEYVWYGLRPSKDHPNLKLYAGPTVWILVVVVALLTAYAFYRAIQRQKPSLAIGIGILTCFLLAFMTYSGGGSGRFITIAFLFASTLTSAQPLIFGSMAGVVCERVGVVNIAIEGQLLTGAFAGVTVASATGSPWAGLIAAPIAGGMIGALLAFFSVRYAVDQIIVGVVLNVLCMGLTSFFLGTLVKQNPHWNSIEFALPKWEIPGLSKIPFIGPVFFSHTILMYIMYIAVIALTFMLFRSRWGLRMRACGEHPKAADTVGINVNRTRFLNTMFGGAIAGLGGAAFTIATASVFTENISAGKGYIALAAMILGKWHPIGALGASLMFGVATAIVEWLPNVAASPIDPSLLAMIPYVITIFAVAGFVGNSRPPAAENIPYIKS